MRSRRLSFVALGSLLFLTLALEGARVASEEALDPGPRMERLVARYAEDEAALRRFYDVPLSGARDERLGRFTGAWRERLARVDFDALEVPGRVDYVLLRNHIERREDERLLDRARRQEMARLLPFAGDLARLEHARRRIGADADTPLDPRAAATTLHEALEEVKRTRKAVEAGQDDKEAKDALVPTPVVAYRASKAIDALRRTLGGWFRFRDGYEPAFGWWVRTPHTDLDKALKGYAKLLREKVAGVKDAKTAPLIGDPIGRQALVKALARELVPYAPEELLAIAEQEMAWCRAEGARAAGELGVSTWAQAVEEVKGLHVPPGEQDDLVHRQALDAVAFLTKHDLVTVPPLCAETWRLEMITREQQKTLPFAVYSDQRMLVAYPTEPMCHASKVMSLRGNNEHFTRIVTPHELIPGHHLQLFMAKRHRAYRSLFRTAFFVEGWALHWEMLLWDLGWQRNAADRIGMLFWRMHRCARIIVTLRFHLDQMEPKAMVDYLVDEVGLERDGATSEVRRYIAGAYGPLYQCAYMLGGLQVRALHKELVGGGTLSQRAFHDAVLREGSIPVELVRAALVGTPLTRDQRAAWRFQGEVEVQGPGADKGR